MESKLLTKAQFVAAYKIFCLELQTVMDNIMPCHATPQQYL